MRPVLQLHVRPPARPHMPHPLRLEFPIAIYHATIGGDARQDIVHDIRDRTYLLDLLANR